MKTIIISDTSPIVTLMKINSLALLQKMFEYIFIPEAVYNELIQNQDYPDEIKQIQEADFIIVAKVRKNELVENICLSNNLIHKGECEAIILFNEIKADRLLIDDTNAVEFAQKHGVEDKFFSTSELVTAAITTKTLGEKEVYTLIKEIKQSKRFKLQDIHKIEKIADELYGSGKKGKKTVTVLR